VKTKEDNCRSFGRLSVLFFFRDRESSSAGGGKKTKTVKDMIVKSTDDSKETIKAVKDGDTYTIDASSATMKKESKGSKSMKFSDLKDEMLST